MEATHAAGDRSTPWILGIAVGVALAYTAMGVVVLAVGILGIPDDRIDQIEWFIPVLGCVVAGVTANLVSLRRGASSTAAHWITAASVGTLVLTMAAFVVTLLVFMGWALEGF